jgi:1,2-diacylglycerol 3-alpha-glucosyltransferase
MNICMFTNTYLPHVGGVARSVHTFSQDLRKLGHRVLIIAPEFEDNHFQEQDVIRLTSIQKFNGSDFSVRIPLPYVVENEIEVFKPDIIHSHHPFLLGDTALRVSRKRGLPLVFTHHTLYEQYTHYLPMDSDLLKQFVQNLATLYANLSDGVIVPSRSIADLIKFRGVTAPVIEIPTGVDVAFFSSGDGHHFRQSLRIPTNAFVLGHVGRLAPEKNLLFLSQAVSRFLHEHAEAIFLVVGDGPGKNDMLLYFQNEQLQERIIFCGHKAGKPLANAYAAMNLFVFSSFSETQGMVLFEAMAAGVPVIAFDASGVRDVVVDGHNGRLLPPSSSPMQFAAAIQEAVKHRERLAQWQGNCLQTAKDNSRQACSLRVDRFYHELFNMKSSAAQHEKESLGPLESLLERIKVEWELFASKVKSVAEAVPTSKAIHKELDESS